MKTSSNYRKRRFVQVNEINVVPYIDVMLVLMVIFMVTAPLLTEGVNVELPKASSKPISSEQTIPFIVHVDVDGQYFLNQNNQDNFTLRDIQLKAAAVLTAKPDTLFLVRGDAKVDFDSVLQAMVALQSAGVDNVGLVTRNPQNN